MPINKWKIIINNWINCYFGEVVDVNIESLVSIVLHLRQDRLDVISTGSRSHILEEFILEKYPNFSYENGDLDLYIGASLVLYFVCTNDKDVKMKSVMCKNLKLEDQEIIMKFNKTLLKNNSITYKEVEAAIIEACGQDTASSKEQQVSIAETPPALRSLHGDVRKLQAALDTERFDKNFLQDELTRTNHKLQKLLKDKEKYKTEILSLKARISSCCGEESETRDQDSSAHEKMMKIVRQLEETEQRLVDTQTQLEDALYERNIYKDKVNELKVERDKWMSFSQQEASRAGTLEEQLNTERCNNESLKEIITELRQHNNKNKLDGSMLECDDPNASVHSIGRNTSICSEACSNIVEVQLMEERANIVELKNQIEVLQDQLKTLEQKSHEEKTILDNKIVAKENYISNLLHEIQKLNQEQNTLKDLYNDEIAKLNNEINELEQKIRNKTEASNRMFHEKAEEIKFLQEDKLSLLQTLSDKTTEFENSTRKMNEQIYKLQDNLNKEQNSKLTMKENYEHLIMKFKEKVLNRNNELVERQNTIIQNSEMIEGLNAELRKQKKFADDNNTKKNNEIVSLQEIIDTLKITINAKNDEVNALKNELAANKKSLQELWPILRELELSKNKLLDDYDMFEKQKSEEKMQLEIILQEKNTNINSLQMEIQNMHKDFAKEKNDYEAKLLERTVELESKNKDCINEKKLRESLEENIKKMKEQDNARINILNAQIQSLNSSISENENEILNLNKHILKEKLFFETQLLKKTNELERKTEEYNEEIKLRESLEKNIIKLKEQFGTQTNSLNTKIETLNNSFAKKEDEVSSLEIVLSETKRTLENVKQRAIELETINNNLKDEFDNLNEQKIQIESDFSASLAHLSNVEEQLIKDRELLNSELKKANIQLANMRKDYTDEIELKEISEKEIVKLNELINQLKVDIDERIKQIESLNSSISENENEILNLNKHILKEKLFFETQLLKKTNELERKTEEYNEEVKLRESLEKNIIKLKEQFGTQTNSLNTKIETLNNSFAKKEDEVSSLEIVLSETKRTLENVKQRAIELETINNNLKDEFDNLNEQKIQIESDFSASLAHLSNVEEQLTKDRELFNSELKKANIQLANMRKDYTDEIELKEISEKEIVKLNALINQLKVDIDERIKHIESLNSSISENENEILNLNKHILKEKLFFETQLLKKTNELERKTEEYNEEVKLRESLEKNIIKLKEQFGTQTNSLNTKIETLNNSFAKKEDEVSSLEIVLSETKRTLENVKQRAIELETINNNLKDEFDNLNEQKIQIESDFSASLAHLSNVEEQLTKDRELLNSELKKANIQLANMRKDYTDEIELKEISEKEIVKLNALINQLKVDIDERIKQIEDYEIVKEKLADTIIDKDFKITELESILTENQTILNKHQERVLELGNTNTKLTEECNVLNNEKVLIKTEFEKKNKNLILLQEEFNILNKTLDENKKMFEGLLNEKDAVINDMKNNFEEQLKIVQDLSNKLSTADAAATKVQEYLTDKVTELQNTKDKLNDEIKLREKLENDIKSLNGALEQANGVINRQKSLEACRENNAEVSNQLKKLATVKDDEITDPSKQISKMSVTENRATRIIRVSAKYQAMILKRVAEIKNVGLLKELTNFGNATMPYDSDILKSLNAGGITMEDLENFLETTDQHLRKCSEKQLVLQKERDRLDSEIINMKKHLTELSVYYKTFESVKELYNEKLTRVVSFQRRVRRDILNLDGRVQDITMAKLERNYTAVVQDLCECAMNFERWVDRCIGRTVSPEKIMQAFTSESASLSSGNFQSTSLEVQIDEIEKSFVKLIEEISRAQRGEGAKEAEAVTVMEVRAEYEDKLNRMKAKMTSLEACRENYAEVSNQLKKLATVKNDEITDLKKQISKMSVTENRATQIIRVSAKYQAMILKRVAEIKNVSVLKELTNFSNATMPYDSEIRKSLSAGGITMEDLENFLETTDKHLRKCSEKQLALQKERDRLAEVCKINDSEIINMKKHLTELSVYYKTFGSVKELYNEKLTRVVSFQRRVRRDILNLDGRVQDITMAKLERNYTAVMQDLCECAMNFERWVDRCIGRTVSPEKIMQAFTSESASLSSGNFQSTSLEVQIDEIEKSFVKLIEEISRAQRGEGAKEAEAVTVMEVRAEYEDKLNRMKAKMKQLYQEQITLFREKQKEEIALLEKKEQEALRKLAESSRAYEEHIKGLSLELWHVGEKFLLKSDEADWLRKKQTSGSLMSLQHVNSSGLGPLHEDKPRHSDTYSLRSLPINKRENRGLHMSDEEGEVFDNRCLNELASTPNPKARSPRASYAGRFSELKWRNSLCPPHLKSSYPAETQFAPAVDEDDIKCLGRQRKEVGITAYKKPGPPTPSKQAGRLSATDSELRESIRTDAELTMSKKTATPSRIKALFRSSRNDTDTTGTPRRRLSIFRSKK